MHRGWAEYRVTLRAWGCIDERLVSMNWNDGNGLAAAQTDIDNKALGEVKYPTWAKVVRTIDDTGKFGIP